jgi:transposase
MSKEKQVLKLRSQGCSQRRIADILRVSRNTVSKIFKAADQNHLVAENVESMDDSALHSLLFPEEISLPVQVQPDYAYVHKELLKSGVTLKLLWEEYVDVCRQSQKPPFMYSHFCKLYNNYVNQNKLIMHIRHKPGDKVMVDWGSKLGEKSTSPRNGTGYHPTFVEYSAEQYELAKSTTWSH